MCLFRCAVDAFKRSGSAWRAHAQSAAALRSEFAELLGDDDAGPETLNPAPAATPAPPTAGTVDAAAAAVAQTRKRKKGQPAHALRQNPAELLGVEGGAGAAAAAETGAHAGGADGGADAAAAEPLRKRKKKGRVEALASTPAGYQGDGERENSAAGEQPVKNADRKGKRKAPVKHGSWRSVGGPGFTAAASREEEKEDCSCRP